jgi:hypothetical protein
MVGTLLMLITQDTRNMFTSIHMDKKHIAPRPLPQNNVLIHLNQSNLTTAYLWEKLNIIPEK